MKKILPFNPLAVFRRHYGGGICAQPGRINRLEGAALVIALGGYQTLLYFDEPM